MRSSGSGIRLQLAVSCSWQGVYSVIASLASGLKKNRPYYNGYSHFPHPCVQGSTGVSRVGVVLTLGPTIVPVSESPIVEAPAFAPESVEWHVPLAPNVSAVRSVRSHEITAAETPSFAAFQMGLPP